MTIAAMSTNLYIPVRACRIALLTAAVVSPILLGGCTGASDAPDAPNVPGGTQAAVTANGTPKATQAPTSSSKQPDPEGVGAAASLEPSAGPGLQVIADAVEAAMQQLVDDQDAVTSEQMATAIEQGFTEAGAVAESVEVSIDSTPTGLDVDAIQAAGRIGSSCIFGEIREGTTMSVVLPVLGSGECFVGDQR